MGLHHVQRSKDSCRDEESMGDIQNPSSAEPAAQGVPGKQDLYNQTRVGCSHRGLARHPWVAGRDRKAESVNTTRKR